MVSGEILVLVVVVWGMMFDRATLSSTDAEVS